MHGYAYSHRQGVTVIPPYTEGSFQYPRWALGDSDAKSRVYNAVEAMLNAIAEDNGGNVWWHEREYTISVTANHERGTYVYRVNPVPPKVSLVKSDDPWVNTQTVGTPPF